MLDAVEGAKLAVCLWLRRRAAMRQGSGEVPEWAREHQMPSNQHGLHTPIQQPTPSSHRLPTRGDISTPLMMSHLSCNEQISGRSGPLSPL